MTKQRRDRQRLRADRLALRLLAVSLIAAAGLAAAWGTASGSAGRPVSGHSAAALPLTWSAPVNIDGNSRLAGISCASATLCAAVDSFQVVTTTNPTAGASAWTATPINIDDASSVSCCSEPHRRSCASRSTAGRARGGRPTQPEAPARGRRHSRQEGAVSAASSRPSPVPGCRLCVATDNEGNVTATANPTGASSAWQDANVDGSHAIQAISCPQPRSASRSTTPATRSPRQTRPGVPRRGTSRTSMAAPRCRVSRARPHRSCASRATEPGTY